MQRGFRLMTLHPKCDTAKCLFPVAGADVIRPRWHPPAQVKTRVGNASKTDGAYQSQYSCNPHHTRGQETLTQPLTARNRRGIHLGCKYVTRLARSRLSPLRKQQPKNRRRTIWIMWCDQLTATVWSTFAERVTRWSFLWLILESGVHAFLQSRDSTPAF